MSLSISLLNILVLILLVFNVLVLNGFKLADDKNVIKGENIKNKLSDETSLRRNEGDSRETKWSYFYQGQWTWHFPLW